MELFNLVCSINPLVCCRYSYPHSFFTTFPHHLIITKGASTPTHAFHLSLAGASSSQLQFLLEPPARLVFSNSSGARVTCAALGSPPPVVAWLTEDGVPVTEIPGLR
ncbi:unnamed protein product [Plutella xylostella]|uniref:(diamondback moth) hypothetical protein n=1 Tax=Plutella xylostella TaxID=51655 RepID=A0A8S4GBT4_PLUXY|nr:unnamed protein product [Plutella xylostella]